MCKSKKIKHFFFGLFLSLFSLSSTADDIEIYKEASAPTNSNIMFILDTSGSMNLDINGDAVVTGGSSRLSIMQNALTSVLSDPTLKNINMGLMRFSGIENYKGFAHGPVVPVQDVDKPTDLFLDDNPTFDPNNEDSSITTSVAAQWGQLVALYGGIATKKDGWLAHALNTSLTKAPRPAGSDENIAAADETSTREYMQYVSGIWVGRGRTPIVDALYEGALYFKGLEADYGKRMPSNHRSAHPSSYIGELFTQPSTTWCDVTNCGDWEGVETCNATKVCTPFEDREYTQYCYNDTLEECETNNPTWKNCTLVESQSCYTECLSPYDEFGVCPNKGETTCKPYNYYTCKVPEPAGVECKHTVCDDETIGQATYISPVKSSCQSNRLILMSDGEPTLNDSAEKVHALLPSTYKNGCLNHSDEKTDPVNFFGRCGPELARYLHNTDHFPALDGQQSIEVSTIGFALGESNPASVYLNTLAEEGGGEFYEANDEISLVSSFKQSLVGVDKSAKAFSNPSYSINPKNTLEHGEAVYLPMFSNGLEPHWSGNLKKFTLRNGDILDNAGSLVTQDGILREDAQDLWAEKIPTHAVDDGGAASLLDPSTRKLLTNVSGNLEAINTSNVSKALLGNADMDDETQSNLIAFIQGYEKGGLARHHMGDIIHSKPVVVTLKGQSRVFVGTNEGYLHSFDTATGKENFAFMPQRLLKNIPIQYQNDKSAGHGHVYGVDAEITAWVKDVNANGAIEGDDKIILYFGLRRGGNAYYALDVTVPSSPVLLWSIDPSSSMFSELGQTWSKPALRKLRYGKSAELKPVLIFGAGYNAKYDEQDVTVRNASADSKGSNVYIINALTGDLVWQADPSDTLLEHAIPSNISALDIDRNGSVDRLYFGDMGGNIWRVDLNAGDFDSDGELHDVTKAKLTHFAALGENSGSDVRKFFYEPDVSIFKDKGRYMLTVAIGSGYRSHPLNENISDRFYVLNDKDVLNMPDDNHKVITDDISNSAGGQLLKAPVDATKNLVDNDYYGWYRDLVANKHEKVLASAVTFMNTVSFTSFGLTDQTTTINTADCPTNTSFESRAYLLDLLRGGRADNINTDFDDEVSTYISAQEISAEPQIIFNKIQSKLSDDKECTQDDCSQTVSLRVGKDQPFADDIDISNLILHAYWRKGRTTSP